MWGVGGASRAGTTLLLWGLRGVHQRGGRGTTRMGGAGAVFSIGVSS